MSIDRTAFEEIYAGQPRWEIGRPQKAFLDVADQITGTILDSGCGTGEIALFFASRGHKVTGIDFLDEPIAIAERKTAERKLTATFLVMDALKLTDWPERYDNLIDSGLFHVFSDDDRKQYLKGLATVLKLGGRSFSTMLFRCRVGRSGATASQSQRDQRCLRRWLADRVHQAVRI